jgi:hypothetical protein
MQYGLVTLRRSVGEKFHEGTFANKDAAVEGLASLHNDLDCLLGEVHEWSADDGRFEVRSIIAQYERVGDAWCELTGELLCRTEVGEVDELLANKQGELSTSRCRDWPSSRSQQQEAGFRGDEGYN